MLVELLASASGWSPSDGDGGSMASRTRRLCRQRPRARNAHAARNSPAYETRRLPAKRTSDGEFYPAGAQRQPG